LEYSLSLRLRDTLHSGLEAGDSFWVFQVEVIRPGRVGAKIVELADETTGFRVD